MPAGPGGAVSRRPCPAHRLPERSPSPTLLAALRCFSRLADEVNLSHPRTHPSPNSITVEVTPRGHSHVGHSHNLWAEQQRAQQLSPAPRLPKHSPCRPAS